MTTAEQPFRVHRRRGPVVPAIVLGLVQIAVAADALFTHLVLPPAGSPLATVAAAAFGLLGIVMLALAVLNLGLSGSLIEERADGLALDIAGPRQAPVVIPWDALRPVEVEEVRTRGGKERARCLMIRFAGSRVKLPTRVYGVLERTRGSVCFRASQLPSVEATAERLNAVIRAHQTRAGKPARR